MARMSIEELERKSTKRLLAFLQKCREHKGIWDMEWELNNNCCGNDFPTEVYIEDVKAILAKREHIPRKTRNKKDYYVCNDCGNFMKAKARIKGKYCHRCNSSNLRETISYTEWLINQKD